MKKLIDISIVYILLGIIIWLLISIFKANLNIFLWGNDTRLFYSVIMFVILLILLLFNDEIEVL